MCTILTTPGGRARLSLGTDGGPDDNGRYDVGITDTTTFAKRAFVQVDMAIWLDMREVVIALNAALLFGSAIAKWTHRWEFTHAVYSWRLVDLRRSRMIAKTVPYCEAVLSVLLALSLPASTLRGVLLGVTLGTFVGFIALQCFLLVRRPGSSCGCTGTLEGVGAASLSRAAVPAALSAVALIWF